MRFSRYQKHCYQVVESLDLFCVITEFKQDQQADTVWTQTLFEIFLSLRSAPRLNGLT